jgi:hypothetical protein
MGRSLWREVESVVFSFCWELPAQSFSGLIQTGLMSIFYCLFFWDSPNLQGQVPVFISPRNKIAQLYHLQKPSQSQSQSQSHIATDGQSVSEVWSVPDINNLARTQWKIPLSTTIILFRERFLRLSPSGRGYTWATQFLGGYNLALQFGGISDETVKYGHDFAGLRPKSDCSDKAQKQLYK